MDISGDPGEILKEVCDRIIHDPKLAPGVGVTHCNEGARIVAQALRCPEFDDESLLADDMYNLMKSGPRWAKVTGSDATIHALGGGLAFAALSSHRLGEAHGHLACIYPVGMQYSGSFKKDVPMVANVGRQNGEEKVSQAFPVTKGEPDYFIYS